MTPSVAIVIPVMDRAADLRRTLPTLLRQDYERFAVYVVDCGSRDDPQRVLREFRDRRLNVLVLPRPAFFSFSVSRNTGARYSDSDLLLFLDADCKLATRSTLSRAVDQTLRAGAVTQDWFDTWRRSSGYEPLTTRGKGIAGKFRRAFGHALASVLLVERTVFQAIGGYNEFLEGWGYEDTDIVGRLELSGLGRVSLSGFRNIERPDDELLRRRNLRNHDIRSTWARNQHLSDAVIRIAGPAFARNRYPGRADSVELRSRDSSVFLVEQEWDAGPLCLPKAALGRLAKERPLASGTATKPEKLPLVSVVIPCKNSERFIAPALESILSQSYPNIECIVVDGASTDRTLEVVSSYGGRLRWISRPDKGAFDAINEGWSMARGEILCWLNADDVWEPDAVAVAAAEFLQHPECDVVYGHCGGIDEQGNLIGFYPARAWNLREAIINCDHIINQAASFIRRPVLEKAGWLYPAWCHDHDLWLRIALAGGNFRAVDAQLAGARIRQDNLGNNPAVVIPGKVGLTERFFATPGLAPELAKLRKRAMSNAYLRCITYAAMAPGGRGLVPELYRQAFLWHPLNTVIRSPLMTVVALWRLVEPRLPWRVPSALRDRVWWLAARKFETLERGRKRARSGRYLSALSAMPADTWRGRRLAAAVVWRAFRTDPLTVLRSTPMLLRGAGRRLRKV